ncbi:MAG: GNAT family N-acetyltransferase [Candidatus Izemoplasmatales bacterium]
MIETDRLLLREFKDFDLQSYYQIMKEKSVCQWLGKGGQRTKEHVLKMIQYYKNHWLKHHIGNFAVIEKSSQELIGHCGFNYIEELEAYELLYAFSPNHWYKGYASEAAMLCLQWLKKHSNIHKLYALSYPDNERSIKVINKLGFQYCEDKVLFGVNLRVYTLLLS